MLSLPGWQGSQSGRRRGSIRMPPTLLYQPAQEYYPALKAHLAAQGTAVPGYVQREFEEYLNCGRLDHGFLRVRSDACHAEHHVAFSCKLTRTVAASKAPSEATNRTCYRKADEVKPRVPSGRKHLDSPACMLLGGPHADPIGCDTH